MRKMTCRLRTSGDDLSCFLRLSRISVLLFVLCWLSGSLVHGSNWIPRRFPNPMTNPLACGRTRNESLVCDPDGIMGEMAADRIDEALHLAHNETSCHCSDRGRCSGYGGYRIGVAVIKSVRESFKSLYTSSQRAAREFAKDVRRQWFRDLGCDDSVLVLFTQQDCQVFISTGRMARQVLTSNEITAICKNTQVYFTNGEYEQGVLRVIREVAENINDRITARVENAILLAFFGGVLLFAFGVLVFCFRSGRCQGEKKMKFPLGAPMGFRRRITTTVHQQSVDTITYHGRHGRRQTVIATTAFGQPIRSAKL
ncbi:uncharacterized protein [Ptychodera flava]|uniref:uncharacterized protein n=1 Tax=Ptychodera flava TaxID=63121 RepID=UPI003969D3F0